MTPEAPSATPPQFPNETEAKRAVRILTNIATVLDNFQGNGVKQAAAIVEMAAYLDTLISFAKSSIPAEPKAEAPKVDAPVAPPAESGLPIPEIPNAPTPA